MKKISLLVVILSVLLLPMFQSTSLATTNFIGNTVDEIPFEFISTQNEDGTILTKFIYHGTLNESQNLSLMINEHNQKEIIYRESNNEQNKELVIDGLSSDTDYYFNITIFDKKNQIISETYSGQFVIYIKEDISNTYESNVIMYNVYNNKSIEGEIGTLGTRYESEPNNTFSSANIIYDDDDVYGYISSTSDVDYFKVMFSSNGNANFWLGSIPPGTDYDLFVYDQSYRLVTSSLNGGNSDELISQQPVIGNQWYYIKIESWEGYSTIDSYHLRAKNYPSEQDDHGNSFASATLIQVNTNISGVINYQGDEDFFRFTAPSSGIYTIETTGSTDTYGHLYNSSQTQIATNDDGGEGTNFRITYNLTANQTYYIKVRHYSTSGTGSYTLRISSPLPINSQWYSQVEPTQSDPTNSWNDNKLDKLFFPKMTDNKSALTPFEWNKWVQGSYTNIDPNAYDAGHMNMWGCVATSHAIVLKNLGAKSISQKYDFRTGIISYQDPDPFTVTWANIQYPSVTYNDSKEMYEVTSYTSSSSPVYINASRVADEFGYNIFEVSLLDKTAQEKADLLTQYLNSHPEGLLVRISDVANPTSRDQGVHTLAFTKSTYSGASSASINSVQEEGILVTEEFFYEDLKSFKYAEEVLSNYSLIQENGISITVTSDYDEYFTVSDPGTQHASKGDNVLFTSSISYTTYGGLDHLVYFQYLEKK